MGPIEIKVKIEVKKLNIQATQMIDIFVNK